MLIAIKLLHTAIWAFLTASILALPLAGMLRRFRLAMIISAVVLLECGVLAINGGRCPLTDLAARYTLDQSSNFDICLPGWLARYNKVIFGSLFVFGELVVIWRWNSSAVKQVLKAGLALFHARLRRGFCFGHDPDALGRPDIGCQDRGADRRAHHVRRVHPRRTLGSEKTVVSNRPRQATRTRMCRAWIHASGRVHLRPLDSGVDVARIFRCP